MIKNPLLTYYLIMVFFQVIHIFEEIQFEAYKEVGSLKKYLIVASILVLLSFLPFFLILQDIQWGIYLGFLPTLVAMGNGLVHIYGVIKTKSFRGTIGAGVFTGVFLSISGVLVLLQLLKHL